MKPQEQENLAKALQLWRNPSENWQRICDICEKAEGLSIEVTDSLAEELVSAQSGVQSLTAVKKADMRGD